MLRRLSCRGLRKRHRWRLRPKLRGKNKLWRRKDNKLRQRLKQKDKSKLQKMRLKL